MLSLLAKILLKVGIIMLDSLILWIDIKCFKEMFFCFKKFICLGEKIRVIAMYETQQTRGVTLQFIGR